MQHASSALPDPHGANATIPTAAPAWVTPQLLDDTLQAWQPFFKRTLTPTDALEILLDWGRLLDLLESEDDQAVRGAGPRVIA